MKKLMIGMLFLGGKVYGMESNDALQLQVQQQEQDPQQELKDSISKVCQTVNEQLGKIIDDIKARSNDSKSQHHDKQHSFRLMRLYQKIQMLDAAKDQDQNSFSELRYAAGKSWLTICETLAASGDVEAQMCLIYFYVDNDPKKAATMCQTIVDNKSIASPFRDIFASLGEGMKQLILLEEKK